MQNLPQLAIYDDHGRPEVAAHIPAGLGSALDVGCGPGGFGRSLREKLGPQGRVVAVEAVEDQAALARDDHGFDEVFAGYYPEALPGDERFDLISFNDVLEHLWDPWDVLRTTHEHLTPGGYVLAAIPSIRYFPVMARLWRGHWDYTDGGTLDWTHVRFFTEESIRDMFDSSGYDVDRCVGANSMFRFARYRRWKPLRRVIGGAEWMHYVVLARSRGTEVPERAPLPPG